MLQGVAVATHGQQPTQDMSGPVSMGRTTATACSITCALSGTPRLNPLAQPSLAQPSTNKQTDSQPVRQPVSQSGHHSPLLNPPRSLRPTTSSRYAALSAGRRPANCSMPVVCCSFSMRRRWPGTTLLRVWGEGQAQGRCVSQSTANQPMRMHINTMRPHATKQSQHPSPCERNTHPPTPLECAPTPTTHHHPYPSLTRTAPGGSTPCAPVWRTR